MRVLIEHCILYVVCTYVCVTRKFTNGRISTSKNTVDTLYMHLTVAIYKYGLQASALACDSCPSSFIPNKRLYHKNDNDAVILI